MKQSLEVPEKEAKTKANEALSAFIEAHKRDPQGACEACLAYCNARMGSHPGAILSCNDAISAKFRTAGLLNNLGFSRLQTGMLQEAFHDLNEALSLNPGLRAARYNRALGWLNSRLTPQSSCAGFPVQALEDICLAVRTGLVTAELVFYAGCIHAQAALDMQSLLALAPPGSYALVKVVGKGNTAAGTPAELQDQAFAYLHQAVAMGRNPATFCDDPILRKFRSHPDFESLLLTKPGPAGPQRELRLVDPLSGLFD